MSQQPTQEENRLERLERDLRLSEALRRGSVRELDEARKAWSEGSVIMARRVSELERALADACVRLVNEQRDREQRELNLLEENSRLALKAQALTTEIQKMGPMGLELMTLRAELDRLLAGKFTPEEVHEFCHQTCEVVSREDFEKGCRAYQEMLYGPRPSDES